MLVYSAFDGDEDNGTMWEQHDCYRENLSAIVRICRDHVCFAISLLQLPWPAYWQTDLSYDHRALQNVHDLLAAAWRFRTAETQPELPFDGKQISAECRMAQWSNWLREEVESWREQPRFIALLMTILANQNDEIGYRAEADLEQLLRVRFSDVPWRQAPAENDDRAAAGEIEDIPEGDICECASVGRAPCSQIPCNTTCARAAREGWGPLE
jgi:hypothetical protein